MWFVAVYAWLTEDGELDMYHGVYTAPPSLDRVREDAFRGHVEAKNATVSGSRERFEKWLNNLQDRGHVIVYSVTAKATPVLLCVLRDGR